MWPTLGSLEGREPVAERAARANGTHLALWEGREAVPILGSVL